MKHQSNIVPTTCLALLGVALSLSQAKAQLIAHEGFDYTDPVGTSVAGLNGGTGWTEAYPTPSGAITLDAGLSFPGATSIGQSMEYAKNANLSADGRNWSATVADDTYWYSMLVNPQILDESGTLRYARGTFSIIQRTGDSQNGFGFRLDNNAGSPRFRAHTQTQAAGANIDFANGYGETFFVLGRITVGVSVTNTTSDLWVYKVGDTLPTSEPLSPMSSMTQSSGSLNAAISGRAFSDSGPIGYDEIYIGTTFESVLPYVVPEPSSGALLLGGLAMLLRFQRRK
jgi:hypothetical protein